MILFLLQICGVQDNRDYCNISSECPYGVINNYNWVVNENLTWYRCAEPTNTSFWYSDKYNKQIWAMNIVTVCLTCIGIVAAVIFFCGRMWYDACCNPLVEHVGLTP
jgi:hypothetical protein